MKMKKNDCNIVRDLMPLVLDRAASDESREMVEEHIAACEACGKQYDAMKAALPDGLRMEYEEEQKKFVHALKAMRKTKLKRRLTAVALSVILCAAAAFGGLFAYDRLVNRYSVPVDNSLYSLSLARLADGSIAVTAEMHGINFDTQTSRGQQFGARGNKGTHDHARQRRKSVHQRDPPGSAGEQHPALESRRAPPRRLRTDGGILCPGQAVDGMVGKPARVGGRNL